MAKLPPLKRFDEKDYPDLSKSVGKFFYQLNLILIGLVNALMENLTLADNMLAQVSTVPVSGSDPVVSFPYKKSSVAPIGVSVINVVQAAGVLVVLTAAVDCSWQFFNGNIRATVRGLDSATNYNVTFVVWGG